MSHDKEHEVQSSTSMSPSMASAPETSFFPVIPGDCDESKPRFVPLSTQVAGHDGVLSDENGFVIIKPCTDNEIEFYQQCLSSDSSLMDCIPAFIGTLQLNTPETLASMAPEVAAAIPSDMTELIVDPAYSPPSAVYERAVVLENLAFGYAKPCILDLKLGFQLWDNQASAEKRARLEAVSKNTTSGTLGVRISGMKVWSTAENKYREYDRSWGKTLHAGTIQSLGIPAFFAARIRGEQKRLIVSRFLEEIERITKALEETDVRIYSPSLLFVYEGDQASLDVAIEDEGKQMIWEELGDGRSSGQSHMTRSLDSGSDDDDDDAASSLDEELARDFCACRMIDFAHATFTPGLGADDNIIKSLRSAKRLFTEYLTSI